MCEFVNNVCTVHNFRRSPCDSLVCTLASNLRFARRISRMQAQQARKTGEPVETVTLYRCVPRDGGAVLLSVHFGPPKTWVIDNKDLYPVASFRAGEQKTGKKQGQKTAAA